MGGEGGRVGGKREGRYSTGQQQGITLLYFACGLPPVINTHVCRPMLLWANACIYL